MLIGKNLAAKADIIGMSFVTVYVDDFAKALEFYTEVLGLEKTHEAEKDACFLKVGGNEHGLFLRGGARPFKTSFDGAHASFVLLVESAAAMHGKLKLNGVRVEQDEPVDMGGGDFWFQFRDPANNVLEILGGA